MPQRVGALLQVVHPYPVAMVLITSAALLVLANRGVPPVSLVVRALGVITCSQVAVGALNDFHDRESDSVWQPDKPIPRGAVQPGTALALSFIALVGLIPLAASFGLESLVLVSVGTGAGIVYDLWLKPLPISFLGYIGGFLSLIAWIWLIAGRLSPRLFLVYPPGTALLVVVHLAQSLPDVTSDRQLGHRGLAAALGIDVTISVILVTGFLTGFCAAALALSAGSVAGVMGAALGVALLGCGALVTQHRRDRPAFLSFFRLVAAGVAVLALSAVVTLEASKIV